MALTVEECLEMERAAREANRQIMIGHCLSVLAAICEGARDPGQRRIWARDLREPVSLQPAPLWSDNDWYMKAGQSGGVFDMHIHDIDVALWWFGRPSHISVTGSAPHGLPMIMDAAWHYDGGPLVNLHASWDRNGGTFRHGVSHRHGEGDACA